MCLCILLVCVCACVCVRLVSPWVCCMPGSPSTGPTLVPTQSYLSIPITSTVYNQSTQNCRVSVIVTLPPPVCVTTVKKRTWRLVMAPNVCECLVVSTKWGREEEVNCEICEMSPRSSLSLRSMVRWLVTDEGWSRRIGARTEQTIFH